MNSETHPWITFTLDLTQAPPRFWMLLSDACAKCEFIASLPMTPHDASELRQVFLERGARATTAIEGNTLSAEQVARLAKGELKLPPSKEYLGIEVQNILLSYQEITARIYAADPLPLNAEWIKRLNAMVLARLELAEDIAPGEIRSIEVGVGRYLCPPAAECERLLARLCEWLDEMNHAQLNAPTLALPILKAVIAHLYLVWIHPFADGNGRTARLLEHHIMLAGGVPETATHLLSDFYNETRANYYRRLEASSKAPNGVTEFLLYALQGFADELSEQIEYMLERVWRDMWAGYIRAQFQDKAGPASKRRMKLAHSLPPNPVHRRQIPTLTPELTQAYSGKTAQTLTRDLNALKRMGLIEQTSAGIRAKTEVLRLHSPGHA